MIGIMDRFRRPVPPREGRARLTADAKGRPLYVIGDVHGCLDELLALERKIRADGKDLPGPKLVVMVGDYVDRGPSSSRLLDHLREPFADAFERVCLAGNHEVAFLDYLDGRLDLEGWLGFGAEATLRSYGLTIAGLAANDSEEGCRDAVRQAVPEAHVSFLRRLPVLLDLGTVLCVHAGLRPGVPLDRHSDDDLIWVRPTGEPVETPQWVIHGHTPVPAVQRCGRAINVDTGAFYSGRLSCIRIWQERIRVFSNVD